MKKNYTNWLGKTLFYIDLENKTYGVYVNIYERNANKVIKQLLEENKEQIEAWKQEWEVGVAI